MTFRKSLGAAALMAALFASGAANAGPAEDLLGSMDGKWRGGGTLTSPDGKRVKLRCSLRNAYQGTELTIAGRCASSAGTRPIRGSLVANGNGVSAKSLRLPGVGSLRGPSARMSGNDLAVSGTVRSKGKSTAVRNTLSVRGNNLTLSVSAENGGSFADRGTISFSR